MQIYICNDAFLVSNTFRYANVDMVKIASLVWSLIIILNPFSTDHSHLYPSISCPHIFFYGLRPVLYLPYLFRWKFPQPSINRDWINLGTAVLLIIFCMFTDHLSSFPSTETFIALTNDQLSIFPYPHSKLSLTPNTSSGFLL